MPNWKRVGKKAIWSALGAAILVLLFYGAYEGLPLAVVLATLGLMPFATAVVAGLLVLSLEDTEPES